MRKLIIIISILNLQSCENKYNLENTFWKHCGDYPISDVIVIGKERAVYVRKTVSILTKTIHYLGLSTP
jgi:hypothetical protein